MTPLTIQQAARELLEDLAAGRLGANGKFHDGKRFCAIGSLVNHHVRRTRNYWSDGPRLLGLWPFSQFMCQHEAWARGSTSTDLYALELTILAEAPEC